MARKKKSPGGDPSAARNPVAEDDGATPPLEPGAAASAEVSDDGPELDEDGNPIQSDDDPEDGENQRGEENGDRPPPPPPPPAPKAPVDPRAELRKRLGEPTPDFPGAIVDPQTGRCENAPPGWDPRRRPPQKP